MLEIGVASEAETAKLRCGRTTEVAVPTLVPTGNEKKRPELYSSGRLGSPPPELPNYKMDVSEVQIECKRHFGNRVLAVLEAVLNRHRS